MLDQALEITSDERLAAGDPDLAYAALDEDPRDARDLLERQQLPPARNRWSRPKTSFGMQYTQRKLQRSVTEMRRS